MSKCFLKGAKTNVLSLCSDIGISVIVQLLEFDESKTSQEEGGDDKTSKKVE